MTTRSLKKMDQEATSKFSEFVHVGSFLTNWQKVLGDEDMIMHGSETLDKKKVAEYLGASEEVITELEEFCKYTYKDALVCPAEKELGDLEDVSLRDGIPVKDVYLDTLRIRHIAFKRSQGAPSQFYANPKFSKGNHDMEHHHLETEVPKDDSAVRVSKVLLQVTLFKALRTSRRSQEANKVLWKEREILVLSDQRLTELKDKITCASDVAWVSSDISENPDIELKERAGDAYPSNFFYIENTFYPDLRNPLATDISKPIQEWWKKKNNQLQGTSSDLRVKTMAEVTFNDLQIRLGYPYLYCHQGNCEHLVVFSDIRLMHGDDCQDPAKYPMLINKPFKKRLLCMICKAFCSKWMTRNDSFTPLDRTFQCDTCFRMLHYDQDGKKLGTFEAYPYIDAAIFS
ncbi:snRNA-activating protein complex subunit 3-like isoform X1 [Apostichopus japonicus]|uniref:snRNA-activating protein complex subunit 3-like isoform X1 n=2 Tax=Stichopus japonicus TaxID=307972 RepID=UPI003AB25F31